MRNKIPSSSFSFSLSHPNLMTTKETGVWTRDLLAPPSPLASTKRTVSEMPFESLYLLLCVFFLASTYGDDCGNLAVMRQDRYS